MFPGRSVYGSDEEAMLFMIEVFVPRTAMSGATTGLHSIRLGHAMASGCHWCLCAFPP